MFNKPHSEKSKKKISESRKGIKFSEEHKRRLSEVHKGIKHTEETKNKISKIGKKKGYGKWMKGKKHSEETKKKISKAGKGRKRLPFSDEWKKKMSEAHKGGKNYNWQGGISFEPYSVDWTKTLKKSIRERDKYICQICDKESSIDIHHIDYDKKNCNPDNLITLCHSCHTKTNYNRNNWIDYFKGRIILKKLMLKFL